MMITDYFDLENLNILLSAKPTTTMKCGTYQIYCEVLGRCTSRFYCQRFSRLHKLHDKLHDCLSP